MLVLQEYAILLCEEFGRKHEKEVREAWEQDRGKLLEELETSHIDRVCKGHIPLPLACWCHCNTKRFTVHIWQHSNNWDKPFCMVLVLFSEIYRKVCSHIEKHPL